MSGLAVSFDSAPRIVCVLLLAAKSLSLGLFARVCYVQHFSAIRQVAAKKKWITQTAESKRRGLINVDPDVAMQIAVPSS